MFYGNAQCAKGRNVGGLNTTKLWFSAVLEVVFGHFGVEFFMR